MPASIIGYSFFFACLFLPLLFYPWSYLSFELPKVLGVMITASFLLFGLSAVSLKHLKPHFVHYVAIFFILWLGFSSLSGVQFEHSFWGSYFRREGLVMWLSFLIIFLASGVITANQFWHKHIAQAISVSGVMVAALGLVEFVSLWGFGHTNQLLYNGRIISTFGQPNFAGSFLVLTLPFLGYWYESSHKMGKKFLVGAILLVMIAVLCTFSRSAYLALAILSFFWGMRHIKVFIAALVSLAVAIMVVAAISPSLIVGQINRIEEDLSLKWTAENRSVIAARSMELIEKRPVAGWGLENFILVFPQVVHENDFGLKDIVVDSAHNLFLDVAVESGLVGVGLFLFLLLVVLLPALYTRHHSLDEYRYIKALMLCVVLFILSHQFSVLSAVPLFLFWFALGGLSEPIVPHLPHDYRISIKAYLSVIVITLTIIFAFQSIRADMLFKYGLSWENSKKDQAIRYDERALDIAPWMQFYQWRIDYLKKIQ